MENRRARPESTASDRQRQIMQQLEEGTTAILTSDGFARYLQALARFHRYSFTNVILIHSQYPEATLVNTYARWQQLGRQVKRGERGIKIFFPIVRKVRDEEPERDTERLVSY